MMAILRYQVCSRLLRRLLAVAFVLAGLFIASGTRTVRAVEVIATFDTVTLVANPNGWSITGLTNTIDGSAAAAVFGRIFTGQQDATGVVIDYGFTVPREQVTRLQLFNNGGANLTDLDGIGTALVEVFDSSNTLLFSGTLNAGNGSAAFDTVFPSPLNNVARVRLSGMTNLLGHAAPDIIWRELRAIQDLNPAIDLAKTVSGPIPLTVGATLTYAFVVTNTGNATLTNVTVTDPLPGMSAITCPGTVLTPGANMTCTATYVVTQADVNAGFVTNTATAIGTPPSGLAPVSDQDSATIPPTQTRSIDLEKTASAPNAERPGDVFVRGDQHGHSDVDRRDSDRPPAGTVGDFVPVDVARAECRDDLFGHLHADAGRRRQWRGLQHGDGVRDAAQRSGGDRPELRDRQRLGRDRAHEDRERSGPADGGCDGELHVPRRQRRPISVDRRDGDRPASGSVCD